MAKARTMEQIRPILTGEEGRCWNLPPGFGCSKGNGYWAICVSGERWLAHRLSYTLLVGPIPLGLVIDHQCHNLDPECLGGDNCPHRRCVNPAHLEAVPQRTNALRGRSFAAVNARRERCEKGHEYVVKKSSRYGRYCPICRLAGRVANGETSGNGHWRERTHCPKGHPYDEANTYVHRNPDGSPKCRMCRACARERARRRREAAK